MANNANQLITGAYYSSGIVSREFETVSGSQISDGLLWLNEIIAEKRVDDGMLPYEDTYNFNSQVGVEKYFIPNLIEIDTIVFYLQNVRYSMAYTKRNQYFGSTRVENIDSLPNQWYWERQPGGGNLYIYFKPDKNYPIEIHGSFGLNSVTEFEDLSSNVTVADLGIPTFYGLGTINPGQLVVNNVDLMGNYPNIGAFINYINSGIIPNVVASLNINNLVLSSTTQQPVPIYIQTDGLFGFPSGSSFIGNVKASTTTDLGATYNNGSSGIGATLTAPSAGVLVIDGYTPVLNDRILVKDQTDPTQNGSYELSTVGTVSVPWVLTRTTNYDQSVEINVGNLFTVLNGTVNIGKTFIETTQVNVVGTSPINFSVFNALTFSNFSTIQSPFYQIFNSNGFDQFYITYLRYALADRICAEYNYDTPPNVMRQLSKYESWIKNKSKLVDLQMQKVSTLQTSQNGISWQQINIGRGFTPNY